MKLKKMISALLASAMIFGISAFAADVKFDDEIKYKDADTVTVNLYHSASMIELDAYCTIAVDYDTAVFSVNTMETKQVSSTVANYDEEKFVAWSNDLTSSPSAISDDPIMTIVFDVLDKNKVVGSVFKVNTDNTCLMLKDDVFDVDSVSITISADESGDDKIKATKATNGSYQVTYPDGYTGTKNYEGKYIVFKTLTFEDGKIYPTTRFDITYDGTTKQFGATLFDTLEVEGSGTIDASDYGFGIAFDKDVAPSDVTVNVVNE